MPAARPKTPLTFHVLAQTGYSVKSLIGQGSFGSVYLAVHAPSSSFRAVKAIFKGDVNREEIDNEIAMMRRVDHATNVARLFDVEEDERFIFICLEGCTGGHLLKRLGDHRQFTERHAAVAIADVLSALKVLHGMGMAHRDVKPQNLIYASERAGSPLKLVDFGLAVDLRRCPGGKTTEVAGSIRFMSPAVVSSEPYGCECDLWALGVVAYLLLSGSYPFNGKTIEECTESIVFRKPSFRGEAWRCVSRDGVEFVQSLLRDPRGAGGRGLSAVDAAEHPWIRNRGAQAAAQLAERVRQSLLSAHSRNLLDQAVARLASKRLQPDDVDVLLKQFALLDSDGDGHVTLAEYLQGVASLEVTYDELRRQFAAYDLDRDGRISKEEFLSACVSSNFAQERTEAFGALAHGGQITPTSLIAAMQAMGTMESPEALAKKALRAIEEADLDRDGQLSFDEFCAWLEIDQQALGGAAGAKDARATGRVDAASAASKGGASIGRAAASGSIWTWLSVLLIGALIALFSA